MPRKPTTHDDRAHQAQRLLDFGMIVAAVLPMLPQIVDNVAANDGGDCRGPGQSQIDQRGEDGARANVQGPAGPAQGAQSEFHYLSRIPDTTTSPPSSTTSTASPPPLRCVANRNRLDNAKAILADEKARKELTSTNGASGTKPCILCTNVFNRVDPASLADGCVEQPFDAMSGALMGLD
jgi:hypothetical protein